MEKSELSRIIEEKEKRKLRFKRKSVQSIWFGLGMFGLIGWSIVVPTMFGIALGMWLDIKYSNHFSWTLSLLIAGLMIGCSNAWYWVDKENKSIDKEQEGKKHE